MRSSCLGPYRLPIGQSEHGANRESRHALSLVGHERRLGSPAHSSKRPTSKTRSTTFSWSTARFTDPTSDSRVRTSAERSAEARASLPYNPSVTTPYRAARTHPAIRAIRRSPAACCCKYVPVASASSAPGSPVCTYARSKSAVRNSMSHHGKIAP